MKQATLYFIFALVALSISAKAVQAQDTGQIVGTVIDSLSGSPLPGVNVIIEGTQQGAAADGEGSYTISGVEAGTYDVRATFIGYAPETIEGVEVSAGEATQVDFAMQAEEVALEDLVVTALGVEREERALGYSVSTVEPEEMTVNRTPNFMDALQGKMAGVDVSSMGTGPQGSSKVRIRGQSSFGAHNDPLIVVNGVPIDNTTFGVSGEISERGSNRNSDSGDGLSSINPDNIEEMTVLKSAAAAALYGARAKDGVILITTKNRAQGSDIQVGYTASLTYEQPLDYRDYQFQYGQGENGERPTGSDFPVSGVWSFGERFEPGMTQTLFGQEVPYEPHPDQFQEYYRSGSNLTNTLNIASGWESGGFNASLSNLRSQAILPGSSFQRNNVDLGFTQTVADRFTLSGNVSYSKENRDNPPNVAEQDYSPVVIYTLANSMPMDLLEEYCCDENGDEIIYSRFTNRTNPYFALKRFENNDRDRVYGNLTARFDLTDWMYVQGRIGQDYYTRDQNYNLPTGSQRQAPAPSGFVNGEYVQDLLTFREINADFLVNANRSFGDFGIDVILGGNQMRRTLDRKNTLVQDFYTRGTYSLSNGRVRDPQRNLSERQVNSLYGSSELSYGDMVYLTGTLRNDWFSTLSSGNRSVLYPSLSASFIVSQALPLPDWVTFGQMRASYAEVGSDTDVPPYSQNLFYSIDANQFNGLSLGGVSGGFVPNPDLRPMRVSEWEVGLEAALFENMLSFEAAYYYKKSTDQILSRQISTASGFANQRINAGEGLNQGAELLVNVYPFRGESFTWNATFNGAYNTTEVLSLGEDIGLDQITVGTADFHGELRQVVGAPMNQLYGWGWLRDEQGRRIFNPETGLPIRSEQQLSFGSSIPNWTGGITNSFIYKDLSMSFLIDFELGHNLISGTHINAYRHGLDKATLVGREQGYVVGDGVTPDGSENTTQAQVQSFYESVRSGRISEESVFNAGSWQLRQITVGYDFTRFLPEYLGVTGLNLSAIARNVAVLKKWVPHIHPDQNGIISDQRQGLEATGLPVTRSLGFNLNLRF